MALKVRPLMALMLACVLPLAAQASGTPHWVHYKLLDGVTKPPKKVVVIPATVKVFEVTAGDVSEEVPDWTNEASGNVSKAISRAIKESHTMAEVPMPHLSAAENASLSEHLALYRVVVNTASRTGLEHKIKHFDYAIGPGLAFLRESGADAAVMIYGNDYASTAGRKAKAVLGSIPIVNIFTGPKPQLGHSFVHVSIIDLRTGDLLWMNSEYRDGASNLREYDDAEGIVDAIFKWYPGIEEYRDAYVR